MTVEPNTESDAAPPIFEANVAVRSVDATRRRRTPDARDAACPLSVVIPVHDEVDNLDALHTRVRWALRGIEGWELVLVDDGSRDGSRERVRRLAETDRQVVAIHHDTCRGQSAALATGFDRARGRVIATLDADLQNDPGDLPAMLARLEADGLDAVLGYRATRRDTWVKRLSSRIGNGVRRWLTQDGVRDTGCATRVVRRRALASLPRFDGMHRFIPALLHMNGFRYAEVPVAHHARRHGRSKYGIRNRALRAFVDAIAVRWMRSRHLRVPVPTPSGPEPR